MSGSDPDLSRGRQSRRRLLGLFAAGGGAAFAALLGRPQGARADDGDPLVLGEANHASSNTAVIATVDSNHSFGIENRSLTGTGALQLRVANQDSDALDVQGGALFLSNRAEFGAFIRNDSSDPDAAGLSVQASGLMPALIVVSDGSPSPEPDVTVPVAIAGDSTHGMGVTGSGGAIGINGTSSSGIGVQGSCDADPAIGGLFENLGGGVGLGVIGRVAFGTVGAATLPAGQDSVVVADDRVRETSHVTITPVTDPAARGLRWVERTPGSGFTAHFTAGKGKAPAIDFTYFIAEHQEEQKGG